MALGTVSMVVMVAVPGAGDESLDAKTVCPYLVDAAGPWRRDAPARSHRCRAVSPVAAIPALTQKRVCLTAAHATCTAFEAAVLVRAESLAADRIRPEQIRESRFGAVVAPLPIAVSTVRSAVTALRLRRSPRGMTAAVIVLVVIGVIGFSLVPRQAGFIGGVLPSSPRPTASVAASIDLSTPSQAAPSAPPRVSPVTSPTVASLPPGAREYVVREGDRLRRIAQRFDTTAAAIIAANRLEDRRPRIVTGQTLIIPAP
jgi:LysM repeat protein